MKRIFGVDEAIKNVRRVDSTPGKVLFLGKIFHNVKYFPVIQVLDKTETIGIKWRYMGRIYGIWFYKRLLWPIHKPNSN